MNILEVIGAVTVTVLCIALVLWGLGILKTSITIE